MAVSFALPVFPDNGRGLDLSLIPVFILLPSDPKFPDPHYKELHLHSPYEHLQCLKLHIVHCKEFALPNLDRIPTPFTVEATDLAKV